MSPAILANRMTNGIVNRRASRTSYPAHPPVPRSGFVHPTAGDKADKSACLTSNVAKMKWVSARMTFWFLHMVGVVFAVLGGQEIGLYHKSTEQLLELRSELIHRLESGLTDDQNFLSLKARIRFIETSDYHDRSLFKGLGFVAFGFGFSSLVEFFRRKKEANLPSQTSYSAPHRDSRLT